MTMVIDKQGLFLPSKLTDELRAAGVEVDGITATEDDAGNVSAIEIICADDTDRAAVDAVCAAHDPTPAPPPDPTPTAQELLSAALDSLDPSTATTADVITALKAAVAS
jgi:nucleoside-diphosphate-sugar epimerase